MKYYDKIVEKPCATSSRKQFRWICGHWWSTNALLVRPHRARVRTSSDCARSVRACTWGTRLVVEETKNKKYTPGIC